MTTLLEDMNKYLEKILDNKLENTIENTKEEERRRAINKYGMIRSFVQTDKFIKDWREDLGLGDEELELLEKLLRQDPEAGDLIEATGGARKLRVKLENNKGKSGGGRIIYVDILRTETIYLLQAYAKNTQVTLSSKQKAEIKSLIRTIKEGK